MGMWKVEDQVKLEISKLPRLIVAGRALKKARKKLNMQDAMSGVERSFANASAGQTELEVVEINTLQK